jgi:hypothetical protein
MFITGLGVGPMFAIFTLLVQGAVAQRQIGTATSSLTLFQQIGGSVGLAIAGTVFSSRLVDEIPRQLAISPVPPQIAAGLSTSGGAALNRLTSVGDLGQAILASVPPAARPQVEPFVADIVAAIHRAFSLATASTFEFGVAAALVAFVAIVFLPGTRANVPALDDSARSIQTRGEPTPAVTD